LFMVFDGRYKLMHAMGGLRPMLFDLQEDPDELNDLAKGEGHDDIFEMMYAHLAHWGRRNAQRVTKTDEDIINMRGKSLRKGILPFMVDGSEVPEELLEKYSGPATQRYVED
jgi:hypothetical protein